MDHHEQERAFLDANPPQRVVVRRTWRERLFSRPWRPWRATRVVWHDPYSARRLAFMWRKVQRRLLEELREMPTPEYDLLSQMEN